MSASESFDRSESPARAPISPARPLDVRPHLHEALGLLLQAHEYADELTQDSWDLAVELPVLRAARVSNSDLRWLVGMNLVEHAIEITGAADRVRQFRRPPLLNLLDATCLILTPTGVAVARELCAKTSSAPAEPAAPANCRLVIPDDLRPKWDDQRRQLRVGVDVVKEFKLPSPNQETVLTAFEEEGWPPRIDDPLPPLPQLDPRRRLHDTIKALNRKQKNLLLRFMGDGSGEGIRWEFASEKLSDDDAVQ